MEVRPFTEWRKIVYDKVHVMQHANQAVDEVRRAEFFPQRGRGCAVWLKGKRWLLLTRWVNLTDGKRQELNHRSQTARSSKLISSKKAWTGCGHTTMRARC